MMHRVETNANIAETAELPVETNTDVAIVGAGPIGLELAAALKREGIDYLQFDARQIGHTISWFPPQTRFFSSSDRISIAGVPLQTPDQGKATREEYLAYLRSVVQQFDLQVRTFEPIVGIEQLQGGRGGFRLTSQPAGSRRVYRCNNLVLATGGTATPRTLGIPGENLSHVAHHFDDPHKFFRRKVLIVGGKNSAIETALRLHRAGAHVSLSYRRGKLDSRSVKYWLLPEMNSLLQSGEIKGYLGTVPTEITPSQVKLACSARELLGEGEGHLAGAGESQCAFVPADHVLLMIGYVADMSLCRLAGVELRGACESPAVDQRTMQTNVPNLYLAGTVTSGTQDKYTVFIENGHVHIDRIVAALKHASPPPAPAPYDRPES